MSKKTRNIRKSEEKEPNSLANQAFRDQFKTFLDSKRNNKTQNGDHWTHKNNCFYHDIYPIAKKHFKNTEIPTHLFQMCQCGIYKNIAKARPQYRIGLNDVLEVRGLKLKNAHFAILKFKINHKSFTLQLLQLMAGEIKKTTQPGTRKKKMGTASFFKDSLFIQVGTKYFIEFRLKSRYTKEKVNTKTVSANKRSDIANWWYDCWAAHGLEEGKNTNLKCEQFLAIHKNTFVGDVPQCCARIVMYVYSTDKEPFTVSIDGKSQKPLKYTAQSSVKKTLSDLVPDLLELESDTNTNTNTNTNSSMNSAKVELSQNNETISSQLSQFTESQTSEKSDGLMSDDNEGEMSMKYEDEMSGNSNTNTMESAVQYWKSKYQRLEKENEELRKRNKLLSEGFMGNNNGCELYDDSVFTPPDLVGLSQNSNLTAEPPKKRRKLNNV